MSAYAKAPSNRPALRFSRTDKKMMFLGSGGRMTVTPDDLYNPHKFSRLRLDM